MENVMHYDSYMLAGASSVCESLGYHEITIIDGNYVCLICGYGTGGIINGESTVVTPSPSPTTEPTPTTDVSEIPEESEITETGLQALIEVNTEIKTLIEWQSTMFFMFMLGTVVILVSLFFYNILKKFI